MITPGIGISLGDPGGVGPEVVCKALADCSVRRDARYILFADPRVLEECQEKFLVDLTIDSGDGGDKTRKGIFLHEISGPPVPSAFGQANAENGKASFHFFEDAVRAAREGRLDALVTAPISKASWRLGGLPWRGHTEYLEHVFSEAIMSFWSDALKVALFSHHLPLHEAIQRVEKDRLLDFFRMLAGNLRKLRMGEMSFLVSGLNPHSGEEGLCGKEDETEILPAVEEARKEGIDIDGPFPPDTVFLKARDVKNAMVIALYHDQGLIPFKLLSFADGVNMTLGLPFLRTSPDHGTAFDIAGKGIANPQSMIAALNLARDLTASVS